MELVKGIKERRSTRKFTDKAVSEDVIREIVATAAYAPSWKNTQTSRYIAVVNTEKETVLFPPPRAHTGSPTMQGWRAKLSVWLPGKKVWEL